ncbi:MAG: ABC transporter substrate-binding protein [Acetobacteraceae bacterium]|nr:ABC transporter substrate-binding protein [Acetobacteraceae bacterium]
MTRYSWRHVFAAAALCFFVRSPAPAAAAPEGTLTIALHVSLAPTWFDPAEAPGIVTPYMFYYLLHDALAKALPEGNPAPALAESWTASPDGMSYEFVLRPGTKFHDNTPVTAEDVRFSFERYRGVSAAAMKERVAAVEITGERTIRFKMKAPWPDFFMSYLGTTSAGWIVPKAHVLKTGEEGFKKAPIGAGPYRYVSFTPGVDLTVEAFEGYWRKTPSVKRIVYKVIPDETVRLVALKLGEVDIALSIRGELAKAIEQTPGLSLQPTSSPGVFWMYFPDQWDPKSPWHDRRVREAARYAMDYDTINQSLLLGHGKIHGSMIPDTFDYYVPVPPPKYDPARARALLTEAGYPNGFDAGFYNCDVSYSNLGEIVLNNLAAVGIRAKLRPLERAAFAKAYTEKKLKDIAQGGSAAFGNTATRFEVFAVKGGAYAYGSYPDIDELFDRQAVEMDRGKRGAILTDMQRRLDDSRMYAPIWQLAFLNGVGPRVGVSGFNLIKGYIYAAPYEDITLKAK